METDFQEDLSLDFSSIDQDDNFGFPSVTVADAFEADNDHEEKSEKKKKSQGGFQSMNLCGPLFKGVNHMGYRIPTPIQRKTIPLIIDGHDVVAMARTGSGKTAAFLIPILNHLDTHSSKVGFRCVILSPTRELAFQTKKFCDQLGKHMDLRTCLIVGGDPMEEQFRALADNPDIVIATPGRLLHILMETGLQLEPVRHIVFDEADRLFEMGFKEQLSEILSLLPDTAQRLLFSATMPNDLVAFAKAGLRDPKLVRLDVESKMSDLLKLSFVLVRFDEKVAFLVHLLRTIIPKDQQTIVFVATKHHVEYLSLLLEHLNISSSAVYGQMDMVARKIAIGKFREKRVNVMVVTDLAARGLDIPFLDNVINFDFPPKAKLFVHRAGRVARAGRSGMAYSMVLNEELPYVLDLHLYLGRPLVSSQDEWAKKKNELASPIGRLPEGFVEDELEEISALHSRVDELESAFRTVNNALKLYTKTRSLPSSASVKRSKQFEVNPHPVLFDAQNAALLEREKFIQSIKGFRPAQTIFEVNIPKRKLAGGFMEQKRKFHNKANKTQSSLEKTETSTQEEPARKKRLREDKNDDTNDLDSTAGEGEDDTYYVIEPLDASSKPTENAPTRSKKKKAKTTRSTTKDENFFIPSRPSNNQALIDEEMLAIKGETRLDDAVFDLGQTDECSGLGPGRYGKKWDRTKSKFVHADEASRQNKKRIKTESGNIIPASYKSDRYSEWKSKTNQRIQMAGEEEDAGQDRFQYPGVGKTRYKNLARQQKENVVELEDVSASKKAKGQDKNDSSQVQNKKGRKLRVDSRGAKGKSIKSELKTKDQIAKQRKLKDRQKSWLKRKQGGGGKGKGKKK